MRIQRIISLACVVAASSLGVACTNDNDQAQSTFHPTWDGWQAFTPATSSSAEQGAYGGGPSSTGDDYNIGNTTGTTGTTGAGNSVGNGSPKTDDNAPATDDNHGMGGLGTGTNGTGTNIDGSGPAGNHSPQAPAIKSTNEKGNGNSGAH